MKLADHIIDSIAADIVEWLNELDDGIYGFECGGEIGLIIDTDETAKQRYQLTRPEWMHRNATDVDFDLNSMLEGVNESYPEDSDELLEAVKREIRWEIENL